MHNLTRIVLAAAVLVVVVSFSAFASGQGEQSLTGTVASISPAVGSRGNVKVVFATANGSYTVTISQSLAKAAALQVGKTITLRGSLRRAPEGASRINARELEVDGEHYSVAPSRRAVGSSGQGGHFINVGLASRDDHGGDHHSTESHRREGSGGHDD